jgi:tRNA(fMet)-specific endonuclease VapC
MLYMLDTNTVSHIIRATPNVQKRLSQAPMNAVAVSAITEAELRYGVVKRGRPQKLLALVEEFLIRVDVLPWTQAVAHAYGDLRVACETSGVTLAPLDMMIAAHAKAVGAILVTNDQAFSLVPHGSFALEDWTK